MRPDARPLPADARAYHEATKHSWASVRRGGHVLDWEIKPFPYKVYPDAPVVALPREVPTPAMPALEAVARVAVPTGADQLDLARLGQLLFFAAGLTKRKRYPGGEAIHFRAAASTGALYEVEVYVVAGPVPGLDPGVYHFCPGDFTLRRLREGDHRDPLAEAASEPQRVRQAPATIVLSAIYWRNTWKYQARAYRHFFWDAGTLLANLLATAVAADLPARVLVGFADGAVNHLLGLDVAREGSLALIPIGTGAPPPPALPPPAPLALATVPLSPREVDYPLVRAAYLASALPDGAAARAWTQAGPGPAPASGPGPGAAPGAAGAPASAAPRAEPGGPHTVAGSGEPGRPGPRYPLAPAAAPAARSLGETILRRGSTRQFAREPIPLAALATILDTALRDLPLDVAATGIPLVEVYPLIHAVEGLPAGAYVYEPAGRALRLLRPGSFREEGGYLCLEQALGADAAAVVFFLADLRAVLARLGNRGYRAVNLAAGLLGGRIYLAAYALGLGASGLTFYDDEVVRFFSPDAAGRDAIFVTAFGRAARVPRRGGLDRLERIESLRPGAP